MTEADRDNLKQIAIEHRRAVEITAAALAEWFGTEQDGGAEANAAAILARLAAHNPPLLISTEPEPTLPPTNEVVRHGSDAELSMMLRQIANELDAEAESAPCSEAGIVRDAATRIAELESLVSSLSTRLAAASEALGRRAERLRWIPVEEALPASGKLVAVLARHGQPACATYSSSTGDWTVQGGCVLTVVGVTHWCDCLPPKLEVT